MGDFYKNHSSNFVGIDCLRELSSTEKQRQTFQVFCFEMLLQFLIQLNRAVLSFAFFLFLLLLYL